jgi:hemerythrin-like domain-containing protein
LEAALSTKSSGCAEVFREFERDLIHHMTWEDESLFPVLKARASDKERRSIESLEIDHERLRDTLRNIDSAMAGGDLRTLRTLISWLITLLKGHNYDEEHGAYVDADRLLDRAERRRLIDLFAETQR